MGVMASQETTENEPIKELLANMTFREEEPDEGVECVVKQTHWYNPWSWGDGDTNLYSCEDQDKVQEFKELLNDEKVFVDTKDGKSLIPDRYFVKDRDEN